MTLIDKAYELQKDNYALLEALIVRLKQVEQENELLRDALRAPSTPICPWREHMPVTTPAMPWYGRAIGTSGYVVCTDNASKKGPNV